MLKEEELNECYDTFYKFFDKLTEITKQDYNLTTVKYSISQILLHKDYRSLIIRQVVTIPTILQNDLNKISDIAGCKLFLYELMVIIMLYEFKKYNIGLINII